MDKLVIDMELFYDRDENGFRNEDEDINALHDQEWADIDALIDNTYSLIEYYSFQYRGQKNSNNNIVPAVGDTISLRFILESRVLENWMTECEVRIELKELTEENLQRLKELGYDPKMEAKHTEHRKPQYWNFRCSVYEGKIIYGYPKYLDEIEELLKKSKDEMLKAERT